MNTQSVAKLLKRFKKDDLQLVANSWSVCRSKLRISPDELIGELGGSSGKKKFISSVLKALRKKAVSEQDVGELDLLFVSNYPTCKSWLVYKLVRSSGMVRPKGHSSQQLQKQLQTKLDAYQFKNVVRVTTKDDAFWIYVNISDNKHKPFSLPSATYIVLYPGADHLCIANLRATSKFYIFQVLIAVMKCSSLEQLDLEGRCVKSLMNIVLHQHSQEMARSSLDDRYPPSSKKRKASESEVLDGRIHQADAKEKRRRLEYVLNRFGDEPQPVLERVTYTLETKFHGGSHAGSSELSDSLVRCHVKFSGPSVLEGIKNLANAGLADIPMKDHLAKIKSLARNKFRFVPKSQS